MSYSEAWEAIARMVREQLARAPSRPFAVVTWQQMEEAGVGAADREAVCREGFGGHPASDGCFVSRSRWTERDA